MHSCENRSPFYRSSIPTHACHATQRHATPRRSTRILQGSADKTGFCDSRFKVMDDDAFQKDRMISWACYRLDRFPEGLQLLPLRGIEGKLTGGKLLVSSKIVYK
jgi:hypothetical protein